MASRSLARLIAWWLEPPPADLPLSVRFQRWAVRLVVFLTALLVLSILTGNTIRWP